MATSATAAATTTRWVPGLPAGGRVVVAKFGSSQIDAARSSLVLEAQPVPTDADLVDGDIVVEVRAAEIVWTDTVMATGQYQHRPRLPYSPGMTYAGVVVGLTAKAAAEFHVSLGQRVAIASPLAGPRSLGRHQSYGGCATYAVAPASAVRRVPDQWSFAEAACFAYGYDTAYHCLVERARVKKGDVVLVLGATGGVGIPALAIAKHQGAVVIAVTRSEAKAALLKQRGADHVISIPAGAATGPQQIKAIAAAAKKLTPGNRGVDIVYDGVGGVSTIAGMRSLKFGGKLLIVGWAATPNVGKAGSPTSGGTVKANVLPTNLIMMKSLVVMGCPAMIAAKMDPAVAVRRHRDLTKWILAGELPAPLVAETFELADTSKALLSRINSGGTFGATVVVQPPRHAPAIEIKSRL